MSALMRWLNRPADASDVGWWLLGFATGYCIFRERERS